MYRGFPAALVPLLRCPYDDNALRIDADQVSDGFIRDGSLECVGCSHHFTVKSGIACMLDEPRLHPESHNEMRLRDLKSESIEQLKREEWHSEYDDIAEILPTVLELQPLKGMRVAEFGCGTGRYTLRLSDQAYHVLAIDFSMASLRVLSKKAGLHENTGLVQADISKIRLKPRSFDRILSTLYSNLPTKRQRRSCNKNAADALKDDGRYVFSMHFHGVRDVLLRVPRSGYYPESGIYRYHLRKGEARREVAPYFRSVRFAPLKVSIPGIRSIALSKAAQRIPLFNGLAQLLLCSAEQPTRRL